MIQTVEQLGTTIGVEKACRVLSIPRSSLYRSRQAVHEPVPRLPSLRALSEVETARAGHDRSACTQAAHLKHQTVPLPTHG